MAANERVFLTRQVSWREPLDAYRAAAGLSPLLFHGPGHHPEARRAVLACGPVTEARLHDGAWTVDGTPHAGDALTWLREATMARAEETHVGWFGYFGYEATRLFEPTLPGPKSPSGTPDAVLRLCMQVAVFDQKAKTVTLHAGGHDEQEAHARLDGLAEALRRPAPATAAPMPRDTAWASSLDEAAFRRAVERLKALIRDGDLFQANLATRFETHCDVAADALFERLATANPSPYMALLDFGDHAVVSCSPEQLFAVEDGRIRARPIAGTRPRGATPTDDDALERDLVTDAKERAEHTMLVDLVRNDIAKVSKPGTTRVAEAMSVERYRHVMHLVSRVEGDLRPDAGFVDCLAALFPGGTITGAPKHRACLRIHEAEPVPRGPYTGSAGYVTLDGRAHWNILIRTLVLQDGVARVHAGSGIVADSDPAREWREAQVKAQALLEAATRPSRPTVDRIGDVTRHGTWTPPKPTRRQAARVLLIDNYDSFVHNLADYCAMAGAEVAVVRNDADLAEAVAAFGPTHLVLGPGPGWPQASGATLEAARAYVGALPMLGVCLGHQALASAHGGDVRVGPTVHGKTSPVRHDGDRLLAHLPDPFEATRYHSLQVTVPAGWLRTAWLDDGTVMAMRHPEHPVWGLQFHPESFCTEGGLETIQRFLEA